MGKATQPAKKHFTWSIPFLAVTLVISVLIAGAYLFVGHSPFWPIAAVITSLTSIALIGYEKQKGKFLWSIIVTVATLGIALSIWMNTRSFLPMISLISAIAALAFLIKEKYKH